MIKNNRLILFLLILIFGVAVFLRFYKLTETFDFNGDSGRDALAAKRIIVDHKFTLIGPSASGGNFFVGPFYYYFIIPSLLIFRFSPLGPVYFAAFIGVLTVVLIYLVGDHFFDKKTALLSSFLYAISPLVVRYARTSGNHTTVPFFSLLTVFFLWRWLKNRRVFDLFLCALFLGFAFQLHYSTVILLFFIVLSLILYRINLFNYKKQFLISGFVFGIINFPLVLFDLRHNWLNFKGLIGYFLAGSGEKIREVVGESSWSFLDSLSFFSKIFIEVISSIFAVYWKESLAILLGLIILLIYKRAFVSSFNFLLILAVFTLVFTSFYKGYLADYYLAFIFPVLVLLFANLVITFSESGAIFRGICLIVIVIIAIFNSNDLPWKNKVDRNINQITEVARIITGDVAAEDKFNLFLKRKTPFWSIASEYRYLTEMLGKRALESTEYKNSDILYFIAEARVLDPLIVTNWEIKEFEPKEILKTWKLSNGTVIYKLGK